MILGRIKLSVASVALLVIQLAIVCSVAAKYLYQRSSCPRVWTRAAAFDPQLLMRGRYLSLQLTVDGCQSTLPSAKRADFPRDVNGAAVQGQYAIRGEGNLEFRAELKVVNNQLLAIGIRDEEKDGVARRVAARPGAPCDQMRLVDPVNFYIAEHARSPLPLASGAELWIEVTVPPMGPPRPIQLALKHDGRWEPLAYE
jgi:hypothetical protein